MLIADLFSNWEGPGTLINGILVLEGNRIPPQTTWFLRIVTATDEERESLEAAGYVLKDNGPRVLPRRLLS